MSKFWYFMGGVATGAIAVIGTAALCSTLSNGTSSSSSLGCRHDDDDEVDADGKDATFARASSTEATEEASAGDPFTAGTATATA